MTPREFKPNEINKYPSFFPICKTFFCNTFRFLSSTMRVLLVVSQIHVAGVLWVQIAVWVESTEVLLILRKAPTEFHVVVSNSALLYWQTISSRYLMSHGKFCAGNYSFYNTIITVLLSCLSYPYKQIYLSFYVLKIIPTGLLTDGSWKIFITMHVMHLHQNKCWFKISLVQVSADWVFQFTRKHEFLNSWKMLAKCISKTFTVIFVLDGVDYGFIFGDMKLSFLPPACISEMFPNARLFNVQTI